MYTVNDQSAADLTRDRGATEDPRRAQQPATLLKRQTAHAQAILPQLLASALQEAPRHMWGGILRQAVQQAGGLSRPAMPLSVLFPQGMSQRQTQRMWNGMVATLLAASQASPSATWADVLQRASAISTGHPMAGDPDRCEDPTIAQVASAAAASKPLSSIADAEFQKVCADLAEYYDCAVHAGYLGGSVLDGVRAIGQEIAGIFSTKKDLQGDYTRALYRYQRDTSNSERYRAVVQAAATLVAYLRVNAPDDKLLQDTQLLDYASKADEVGIREEDVENAVNDAVANGGSNADSNNPPSDPSHNGGSPDRDSRDTPNAHPGNPDEDIARELTGIRHTEDLPEVTAILTKLVSDQSNSGQAYASKARRASVRAYKIAAALAWLNADDQLIYQVYLATPPTVSTLDAMFQWAVSVARRLASTSAALADALRSVAIPVQGPSSSAGPQTNPKLPDPIGPANPAAPDQSAPSPLPEQKEGPSLESEVSGVPVH